MMANQQVPLVSVIIPTHNRSASLSRTLAALRAQTYAPSQVELLVVADGCTDETVVMLKRWQAPFRLHIIEQAGQGAAAARNRGAAQASGRLLLFLDDDVVPASGLIEAHVRAHQAQPGQVILGPYLPTEARTVDFFQRQLRNWWENKFSALAQPGHRFTYQDLLSGNFSLEATLFHQIGGFDESIQDCGGEDYEFGLRLIKADIPFRFVAEARGDHYIEETTNLERIFKRARQEGRAEVIIGQRHPEIRSRLLLAQIKWARWRYSLLLRFFIFILPLAASLLVVPLQHGLYLLERARLRAYWQRLYSFLHFYWYWRGVADKLESWPALQHFIWAAQPALDAPGPMLDLDLSRGLALAEQQLDQLRPAALRIYYGQQPVGLIPPHPGAEQWRGKHLRAALVNHLAVPLLEALAVEGAIEGVAPLDRYRLYQSIRAKTLWFGPTKVDQMWFEQYSQWNQVERQTNETLPAENWELLRKAEYERAWAEQLPVGRGWRDQLYLTLYHWHQPFYQWYSRRGWSWLTSFRERVKQLLLGQAKV